jgi:hypothetical protein
MFLCVGEFKNKDVKTVSAHHLSGSNVCPILQRNLYKTRVIGQIFSRHRHWSIASTPPFRLYDLKKKTEKKNPEKKTQTRKTKKKKTQTRKTKKKPQTRKTKKKTPNTKNEKKKPKTQNAKTERKKKPPKKKNPKTVNPDFSSNVSDLVLSHGRLSRF